MPMIQKSNAIYPPDQNKSSGFMRFCSYLLLLVIVLSCSGMTKKPTLKERSKPEFPDTELKQVIVRSIYYPANPERVIKKEKILRRRGDLKEGETLKEKYPEELNREKEKYIYTNTLYCYNEVKIEDRPNCYYNDNLKIRFYDKEGKVIAEDCLRLQYPEKYDEAGRYSEEYLREKNAPDSFGIPNEPLVAEEGILEGRAILTYISYNENSYAIRIVRLEGEKEIIIKSFSAGPYITKSELIQRYDGSKYLNWGYNYDEETQCHISPGPM